MPHPKRIIMICTLVFVMAILSCRLRQEHAEIPINPTFINSILCNLTGGTWTYSDEFPRSGWCDPEKRSDDHPTVDNHVEQPMIPLEEEAAQVETLNEQSQIEAPLISPQLSTIITYQGSTSIGSYCIDAWGGQIIMDEITIFIDDDGSVSGTLLSIWESGKLDPIDGCVSEQTRTTTGDLSGKLSETNRTIQIEFTHANEILRSGCPAGNETIPDSWTSTAEVQLSGDKISGSTSDGFSFEAFKQ